MSKRMTSSGRVGALSLVALSLSACTGIVVGGNDNRGPQGGSAAVGAGAAAIAGSGGSPTITSPQACEDGRVAAAIPQRLVRLSYSQLGHGVSALLGTQARAAVAATKLIPSASQREFQPLFNEGPQISSAVLPKTLQLVEAATSVVTGAPGCAAGDDVCAQAAVLEMAGRAYRRPLTADEQGSLTQLYTDLKAHGNSSEQAFAFAARGVLLAAPALYRTEFGTPSSAGRLSSYEIASQLSYFLADAPPDSALLDAAATGGLDTQAGVAAQVDRLLQTEAVRTNLQQVMGAYFQLGNVLADVKDPALYPEYTAGLRNSLLRESQLFLEEVLFGPSLSDLLTSRRAHVNKVLAPIYGVTYPGQVTDLDDVFKPVELPAGQRAGLLTRGAVLSMRSRPEETSVVSRGLFVNATVLCAEQPPEPPAAVLGDVGAQVSDKTTTQRQKAENRAKTSPCSNCHQYFDGYGLALEAYDAIGRFRTSYGSFPGSPPIDTSAQLPAVAGGGVVKDALELIDAVIENGRFSQCMAANLMRYALADASLLGSEDCGVVTVNERFRAGSDHGYAALIREVALSGTIATRVAP